MSSAMEKLKRLSIWAKGSLGLAMLAGIYGLSIAWAFYINVQTGDLGIQDKKIIRVVHSISEDRVKAAFNRMAREYEALHPDVKVMIQSIPERAYQQWATTQFIGDTAPDLIQTVNRWSELWENLASRYLVSLTELVNEPNPYNDGGPMEGLPWRETYIDNMEGGYWPHLLVFYSIPLTLETTRLYYNKDLFKKATGSDAPPRNFEEWMAICRAIEEYAESQNTEIFPLAVAMQRGGSSGVGGPASFHDRFFPVLTGGMMDAYDWMYNGNPDPTWTLFGVTTDSFDLKHPRIRAAYEMMGEISQYFQSSFISDDPSQTHFHFIQEKAGMVIGTSRDARIITENALFKVGVSTFPLPTRDHPRYGKYVAGPLPEEPIGTFHFGLNKSSEHPEIAIDFMRFCTSRKMNERFCKEVMWFPVIRQAEPLEFLKPFKPNIEGVRRHPMLYIRGGLTFLWFQQHFPLFLSGQVDFDTFMDDMEGVWRTEGVRDYLRRRQLYDRFLPQVEYNIAKARAPLLFEEAGEAVAGQAAGSRTIYQLGMEVFALMYATYGALDDFTWTQLQEGNYVYPKPEQPLAP